MLSQGIIKLEQNCLMMEIRLEEIEKKVGIEITFRSIAKGKYKLWLGKVWFDICYTLIINGDQKLRQVQKDQSFGQYLQDLKNI